MVKLGYSDETITLKNTILHKIVSEKLLFFSPGSQSAWTLIIFI